MASQRTIRVPVPEPFREFMCHVAALMREKAPPVIVPSDDLLQGDCGYGGLSEDGHFEFVFFPPDGGTWTTKLSAGDIAEIEDGRLSAVTFMVVAKDPWLLPALSIPEAMEKLESIGITGLGPRSTRSEITAKLGPPGESFEGKLFEGKMTSPWIKYFLTPCQVLFGFNAKGKLKEIQFYPAEWRP